MFVCVCVCACVSVCVCVCVRAAQGDRENKMIAMRKQPHGLSGQTKLRAPCCLSAESSDMRKQAARRSGKQHKEGVSVACMGFFFFFGKKKTRVLLRLKHTQRSSSCLPSHNTTKELARVLGLKCTHIQKRANREHNRLAAVGQSSKIKQRPSRYVPPF